jgi:hypothetical protein
LVKPSLHPIQLATAMQSSQQAIRTGQKDEKGRSALSPPRQVLERRTSLCQAVFLGAVEPEEATTMSDEEMLGELRETQAAVDA